MIPVSTATAMSAAGAAYKESSEEAAIASQFDSQIILAAGRGDSQTISFRVNYAGTPLDTVVAAYQTAGYTVQAGPDNSPNVPPRNPYVSVVKISW